MLDEWIVQDRLREFAHEAEQARRAREVRCGRSQVYHRIGPLRRQVGCWLIASGRRLAGDGERAG